MKKQSRIYLAAIRRQMQERFRYAPRKKRNEAFAILYHGWRQQGFRHGRNKQFYTIAWRRAWLAPKDADDLRKYIGLT